jgi:hypothetical protein
MKYRRLVAEDREAMQWNGDNLAEIKVWMDTRGDFYEIDPDDRDGVDPEATGSLWVEANATWLALVPGEWIIKDAKGFYPCKPDIFAATYEPVDG